MIKSMTISLIGIREIEEFPVYYLDFLSSGFVFENSSVGQLYADNIIATKESATSLCIAQGVGKLMKTYF